MEKALTAVFHAGLSVFWALKVSYFQPLLLTVHASKRSV